MTDNLRLDDLEGDEAVDWRAARARALRAASSTVILTSFDCSSTEYWSGVVGAPLETFARPTIKRHNPNTVRHNVAGGYHGCVVIQVQQSASLYRFIEGFVAGTVVQLPQCDYDSTIPDGVTGNTVDFGSIDEGSSPSPGAMAQWPARRLSSFIAEHRRRLRGGAA